MQIQWWLTTLLVKIIQYMVILMNPLLVIYYQSFLYQYAQLRSWASFSIQIQFKKSVLDS